jgi:hypothetical protein
MFLNFITTNAAAAATTFTRRTVGQRRMRPELERINGMARRMASTAANAQIPVIQKVYTYKLMNYHIYTDTGIKTIRKSE